MNLTEIPISYSFRNLLVRGITTSLTAFGLALVVYVFTTVLMLDEGLKQTLVSTGEFDNVVVTRRGAVSEIQSSISREQASIISQLSEVASIPYPQVSKELVVLVNLPKKKTLKQSNVVIRGLNKIGVNLRRQIKIIRGRNFREGSNEIIVGSAIVKRFENMQLGQSIKFGSQTWKIVGYFDSGRSGFDSEIWTDVDILMQSFRRTTFSTIVLRLVDSTKFNSIKKVIDLDIRLPLQAKRERIFFSDQSKALSAFIKTLGLTLTIIFSIGAIIGAAITMQSAVANRVAEIGTLRALGFKRGAILSAFLLESIFLSIIGGVAGLFFAVFMMNLEFSTTNFTSFSELAFRFSLSTSILFYGLSFSVIMGVLGGMIPAIRASNIKIVDSLRAN